MSARRPAHKLHAENIMSVRVDDGGVKFLVMWSEQVGGGLFNSWESEERISDAGLLARFKRSNKWEDFVTTTAYCRLVRSQAPGLRAAGLRP